MRGGVEIRQLTYFVTVAEELGFGRAAERLHIVQPAVSQQIRRLERELGVLLFDRSSRHVAADVAAGAGGILRVGTSQGLGERLDRTLEELRKAAPGLQVRLVSAPAADRIARVRAGELDAAFVRAVTAAPGVELLPMWREPLTVALAATHPLAAQPAVKLAQLRGIPLRLAPRSDNPPFHDLILGACADAGFEPLPGPPFTTPQDTLAEIGTGPPALTPLYIAAADLMPMRRVAFRPLAGLTAQTCLVVPPGPPAPALRHLLDACASANPDSNHLEP